MEFEKRSRIYRTIMIVILAMFVTFVGTLYGYHNYYFKTDKGRRKALEKYLLISDSSKEIESRIELIRTYLDEYYLADIDEGELVESAIKGYVKGLRRYLYGVFN